MVSRFNVSLAKKRHLRGKLKCTYGACFEPPMTTVFTADQYWFSSVVLNLGLPVYTEFPCLKIFPLYIFQKKDCPRILAHTFGIGLVLLMVQEGVLSHNKERSRSAVQYIPFCLSSLSQRQSCPIMK